MLHLEALDYFDFFLKVDVDVRVWKPMHTVVAHTMHEHGAHFLHTMQRCDEPISCDASLNDSLVAYVSGAACPHTPSPELLTKRCVYYANFIAGWLGLFQSPQMLQYSEAWWAWPGGWRYRWTDQQFWTYALWVTNMSRIADMAVWRRRRWFTHKS